MPIPPLLSKLKFYKGSRYKSLIIVSAQEMLRTRSSQLQSGIRGRAPESPALSLPTITREGKEAGEGGKEHYRGGGRGRRKPVKKIVLSQNGESSRQASTTGMTKEQQTGQSLLAPGSYSLFMTENPELCLFAFVF